MATTLLDRTKELLGQIGSALVRNIPVASRTWLYQTSRAFAAIEISMDKKALLAERNNLVITATEPKLNDLGNEYLERGRFDAKPAELIIEVLAADTTVIPVGTKFVGTSNGLVYISTETVIGTIAPVEFVPVTSELSGAETTMEVGQQLDVQTPIAGMNDAAFVGTVAVVGTNIEGIEEFRNKILDEVRRQGGGSNLADYRSWGQEVEGVKRVYPIAGLYGPSSRTIFVQATEDIDPDGIAPQSLLDEVLASLITDPATQINRICMGVPDATLTTESISRQLFEVQLNGTSGLWSSDAIAALETALANYLLTLSPYIAGLDPISGRTDSVSNINLSAVVESVAGEYGLTPTSLEFRLDGTAINLDAYQLPAGVLAKLSTLLMV